MPSSEKSTHDVDDVVSIVSSITEESDDSRDNTKWLIILTSFVMAIAFPTLLYFFAPYQLISVGSALLNLQTFVTITTTAALITGALVIGIGVFSVFSLIGATISYIFEDAKPAESLTAEEPVEEAALAEEESLAAAATTAAGVTFTLPTTAGDTAAPSAEHSAGSVLPPSATVAGATPGLGIIAAEAASSATATATVTTTDPTTVLAGTPGSAAATIAALAPPERKASLIITPPLNGSALAGTSATLVKPKVKETAPQSTVEATGVEAPEMAVDTAATTATAHSNIPVAIKDAFNTATTFMIQHPAACFGGASMVLIGLYHLANMFSGNDSSAVGVGSTILATTVNHLLKPIAMVTCLYPNITKPMQLPVPAVCPDDSAMITPVQQIPGTTGMTPPGN